MSALWRLAPPAAALALVCAVVAAVMSGSEQRLAGTNNVQLSAFPVVIAPGERFCQDSEVVPADAAALQLVPGTERRPGPPLELAVDGRRAHVPGGYRDAAPLVVPVPAGAAGGAGVCVRNLGSERVLLGGQDAAAQALPPGLSAQLAGEPVAVAAQILYWRGGEESGWDVAGAAIERWGRATALGAATPWLALAAFGCAFGAAVALAARARAGVLACGAVALASAAGWALTTPAFHVPDEPQHLAYAQYLFETGELPRHGPPGVFSAEEGRAFEAVAFNNVAGNRDGRPPWRAAADAELDRVLASEPGRVSEGGGTNTTNNPPLYYALQAAPLAIASGGDFLDRLLAMRLLSALLAGLTVAFVVLFLRELLPGAPWAWPAGALALAVQPLLGFVGGGVNNDAGLFAAGAAVLWLVARAFRRGLDRATAIGLGAALGLGLVVKATLLGLVPGLLAVLVVLVVRSDRSGRGRVLRLAALSAAVAAVPVIAYVMLNSAIWDRPLWGGGVPGSTTAAAGRPAQLTEFVGYVWQFYLPRLPFMDDQQAGIPLYNVWFQGFIARYGWLDTSFPAWAYDVALAVFAGVLALAGRALWSARRALAGRRGELLAYAALMAGFLLVVAWAGYGGRRANGFVFEQARYLLPLAALYAAVIALAARGAGRLGPPVGAALVVLACGHAILSVLLVADRFYV